MSSTRGGTAAGDRAAGSRSGRRGGTAGRYSSSPVAAPRRRASAEPVGRRYARAPGGAAPRFEAFDGARTWGLRSHAAHTVSYYVAAAPRGATGGGLDVVRLADGWLRRHAAKALRRLRLEYGKRDFDDVDGWDESEKGLVASRETRSAPHPKNHRFDDHPDWAIERVRAAPENDALFVVHGDAHARHLPFDHEDPAARHVAIVLEQYRLPPSAWPRRFSKEAKAEKGTRKERLWGIF